jgi:AraC-like DNA-binding protein
MIKKVFGDDSMSEVQIKLWYSRFKDGRESVESDRRYGRPSTNRTPKNVERFQTAINENRRLTLREIEEDLGIPRTIVSRILTEDLGVNMWSQYLFGGSCHESRRTFVLLLHRTHLKPLTMTHIFSKRSKLEMSHGSRVTTLKKSPVFPMEVV